MLRNIPIQVLNRVKRNWTALNTLSKTPRKWSKFYIVAKNSLLIMSFILVFIITFFENISISRVYEGIYIPDVERSEELHINLNFSEPTKIKFILPYKIENNGFYDLNDINLKISLKLVYINKDTEEECVQTILTKNNSYIEEDRHVLPGNVLEDSFEVYYQEFNWRNIDKYQKEVDKNKDVKVLMDVLISFYLVGIERDWISFTDIDISGDVNPKNENLYSNQASTDNYSEFLRITLISLTIYVIAVVSSLAIQKYLKNKGSKSDKFYILIRILVFVSIIIGWSLFRVYTSKETTIEGVDTGDYALRYEIITWTTIFLMILIYIILFYGSRYPRYSTRRGFITLLTSSLGLLSLSLWSFTSIIEIQIENTGTIVRDMFPSLVPSLISLLLLILLNFLNLIGLNVYQHEYKQIEIKRPKKSNRKIYRIKNNQEFNQILFRAIKNLNEEASITKIKRYLKKKNIIFKNKKGDKLNRSYLEMLVKQQLLDRKVIVLNSKKNQQHIVYQLTQSTLSLIEKSI